MAAPQYALAAGYDVALGSLDNLHDTIDVVLGKRVKVRSWGTYREGVPFTNGLGIQGFRGFPSFRWIAKGIYREQAEQIRDDYLDGLWSNEVTAYSLLDRVGEFTRVNAVLTLQQLADSQTRFGAFEDWIFEFTKVRRLVEP